MAYQAMDEYQLILIGYCPHNGELFSSLFHVKQPKKSSSISYSILYNGDGWLALNAFKYRCDTLTQTNTHGG